MTDASEKACENPAYNPNAFPDLPIETVWTSSSQFGSPFQACLVYTFTGQGHCRWGRTEALPFMLVNDPKAPLPKP